MQQIINVITPADSQDLTTLDEMKALLRIPPADTSSDALLGQLIVDVSETIARMCNRIFGFEEVEETYFQLSDDASRRLYLTRWPVALADISLFASDGSNDFLSLPEEWVLEEATGTLYRRPDFDPWGGTIDVVYSGGYKLPDDAPGPLKFAAQAVIREGYMGWIRNPALYGVRQTRHKESSQTYYPPNLATTLSGASETLRGVQGILQKYVRLWV